ncbi:MAG: hypothetical protein Q4G59_05760, partial [Planctomycetia bacterium]|nr:hypothetical protein [Planctomycetia bacterium]
MRYEQRRTVILAGLMLVLCLTSVASAQMSGRHWGDTQKACTMMDKEIEQFGDLNLLTFPDAVCVFDGKLAGANLTAGKPRPVPSMMIDGTTGNLGAEGRMFISGKPHRFVFYLGQPRAITSVRVFTANVDTRANQDYEVRLVRSDNPPEKIPAFPKEPTLTTGKNIVGANKGGYSTYFQKSVEENLFPEKYNWVEFLFWETWPINSGRPGKDKSQANNAMTLVELQILGNPTDPSIFKTQADREKWLAKVKQDRIDREIAKISSDLTFAYHRPESLKLAIADMMEKYPDELGKKDWPKRWEELKKRMDAAQGDMDKTLAVAKDYGAFRREVLLANPILDFDEILLRKTNNPALMQNWISNCARNKGKYNDSLVKLNVKNPSAPLVEVCKGRNESFIGDISLHWDADRCLVTALADNKTWQIFECNLKDGSLKQITPDMGGDVDNVEGCYVP